ncbi:OmpA family protein, partial [candidate division WOR-3 bacterium]|nr:OmpA family protein [candidate division WOR-3 bacterium]
ITDSTNITTGWGVAPAWAGIIGISYCHNFKPEKPTVGNLSGVVRDRKTDEPLEANIGLYRADELVVSEVSDADGFYAFNNIEPGVYELTASASGYQSYSTDLLVKAGETIPLDIDIDPLAEEGTLILRIIDLESQKPIFAEVSIGDVVTETVTEKFEKNLDPGSYGIVVVAEDYLLYEKEIIIEPGKTLELEVALVKKEFVIYFETNKVELKPESHETLDKAAVMIKKLLAENPDITVELQGYTDNRNSEEYNIDLSERRAGAVKNYLVTKHNIETSRLITKGYGESRPVASNDTPEGMTKNRRVELIIVK